MTRENNLSIAKLFLERIGSGESAQAIAEMFSDELHWNVPGDTGVLPWIGNKTGRLAVTDFLRDSGQMLERVALEVHEILASDDRAIILGDLASRVVSTGKTIETPYAIVLTLHDGKITRFLMLEDSFATAMAARVE
jgi:ketosteroid isomerase-like protein